MKKILKTFSLCGLSFLFLATLFSCENEEMEDTVLSGGQEQDSTQKSLTATLSDGLYTNWSAGDAILLLHDGKTVSVEAQESGSTSSLSGTVEGTFTDDNPLYGIFPTDGMVSSDYESVTVTIPAIQTDGGNGYDAKSAVAVARTISNSLNFHTVCGGIKLNFQMSGVTKVELESVDGYALSGTVRIKWDAQGKPVTDETGNAKFHHGF